MILTCPNCNFHFEIKEIKENFFISCPSCQTKWNVKRKEKENFLCYIADHPRSFRNFVMFNIAELGIEYLVFDDGFLLREAIREKLPNLIITNVFLPNVLGVDICEEVKNNFKEKNVSVILIGAIYKLERYHRKPKFLYGADEYIEEGISSKVFKSIVKRLLGISYEKEFIRTPEEEQNLRRMRILISEIVGEYSNIIDSYLNGGDKEQIKELFLKAKIKLKEKAPDLSEDLMKSFLIQYLRKKLEERKNG